MTANSWAACGAQNVRARSFSGKVGHVVERPTDWAALYDGVFLGSAPTLEEAERLVELHAVAQGWQG